jgi:hypothetical protein
MKKIMLLGLTVLLFLPACERGPQAPFDEDDEIVIQGTYYDDTGDPLIDQWVGFWINSPESFFTNFLGLDPEESDRTDSTGTYTETFVGADLMDAQGATFKVIVMNYDPNWPDTMPKVWCDFFPLDITIDLPDLTLWRGDPTVSIGDTNITFSWTQLSSTHNIEPDNYLFQVKATQDGAGYTLWQEDLSNATSITLPGYVLPQAYVSKWRAIAQIEAPSESDCGYNYISDPDTTEIPDNPYQLLSLGKNCYAEAYQDPYPKATDGKWGPWPTYCVVMPSNNVSWIYVDLDTTITVNAVVMYGMTIAGTPSTQGYDIYVSDDTLNWGNVVASNNENTNYFYIDGFDAPGRFVKLEAKDAGIGITGFRELCIFGQ